MTQGTQRGLGGDSGVPPLPWRAQRGHREGTERARGGHGEDTGTASPRCHRHARGLSLGSRARSSCFAAAGPGREGGDRARPGGRDTGDDNPRPGHQTRPGRGSQRAVTSCLGRALCYCPRMARGHGGDTGGRHGDVPTLPGTPRGGPGDVPTLPGGSQGCPHPAQDTAGMSPLCQGASRGCPHLTRKGPGGVPTLSAGHRGVPTLPERVPGMSPPRQVTPPRAR